MNMPHSQVSDPRFRRVAPRRAPSGRWYFVLSILTLGMFAWVPFLHAAQRLGRSNIRRRAAIYGGVAAIMVVIGGLTPEDSAGNPVGLMGSILSSLTIVIGIATVVIACLQLAPLKREVYGGTAPVAPPVIAGFTDPAVATVLAARARRMEARNIVAKDPLMARELRIGRPDELRKYDDGGLVDLNHAQAVAISSTCGVSISIAEQLVQARTARGGAFSDASEALIAADIPVQLWDQIRDRAVLL
jgi:drug/metabolite transporter superfamily protein YnfA